MPLACTPETPSAGARCTVRTAICSQLSVDEVVNGNSPEPHVRVVAMKDESELDNRVMNLERKVRAGRMAGGVIEMKLS